MNKTGYLFAGQGAQRVGMGMDLYENFAESRAVFKKADEVLGFSISELCFQGPAEELTLTRNCQPAILTMTVAAWEAFKSIARPDLTKEIFAAGLSLGEYSALVAAEVLNFEDAVYLVRRRGEFMEDEAIKNPGKMLCIMGLGRDKVEQTCGKAGVEIANFNSPDQIVVSGGINAIKEAGRIASELGAKRVVLLEVSGAFHSSFMEGASLRLKEELEKVKMNEPRITVVNNVDAKSVSTVEEIKKSLIRQVSSSVLWEESMRYIVGSGVKSLIEFGPGKVLRGLMRRIDDSISVSNIEKKLDLDKYAGNDNINISLVL